jgi:heme-degrading monooxygenase HmoA
MFAVIFEVQPKPDQWDAYLANAGLLRPDLLQVDGFVDNIRYRSLTRDGWLLSLSGWRDEKSVVRWRTTMSHHIVQQKGRNDIFLDYHLRVGQVTQDTRPPGGQVLREQRLDETETGSATTIILIDAPGSASANATKSAATLGLDAKAHGLVGWDVFDAVLTPGDGILLTSWRANADAEAFAARIKLPDGGRLRRVRVVRDYGMFDRREAPQYYPAVERRSPAG